MKGVTCFLQAVSMTWGLLKTSGTLGPKRSDMGSRYFSGRAAYRIFEFFVFFAPSSSSKHTFMTFLQG
jgi:hypothetical protein